MSDDLQMAEWLNKSTEASGVPLTVEDPAVLAQVAQLIKAKAAHEQ